MKVAVLFARNDSVYKTLPDCDVWDFERDALKWQGGLPGIYHPPCRAWGNYSTWAKPRPNEKDLAIWAIEKVRNFGGVLEHPYSSKLWKTEGFAPIGMRDSFGGVRIPVFQSWWGHRAPKKTTLYIVGNMPQLPEYQEPVTIKSIEHMSVKEREKTPPDMAKWLVEITKKCAKVAA